VTKEISKALDPKEISCTRAPNVIPFKKTQILDFLPPGSFATIENQPIDLPPFQIIRCKAGSCLVRQQSWGRFVHWEVPHHRLNSA
tara:strand:+ start:375 stop:632 length:258 start_codon:yes stop_codon:yes gene_type:complete